MNKIALKTENLSKEFKIGGRKIRALKDINMEIKKGDFIAIMGPSGSGKTTLLNMLGCLDKPTAGRVILDGVDITRVKESDLHKTRKHRIGFVFQTFNLMPWLSAVENVELPMEGTGKTKQEIRNRANSLLDMVGLSERKDHRPHKLSAGEQQRVAIARALANNPALVLADEVTGNLDGKTKRDIMKLLGKLNIEQNTTIIIVTHDSQVASLTSRMLLIRDGRLLLKEKQGAHQKPQNN